MVLSTGPSKVNQAQTETVESWMERLRELCKGYKPQDIWNEDETGCFVRFLTKVWQRKDADARVARNLNSE